METNLARIAENVEKHPKEPLQTLVHAINPETLATRHQQMNGQKASGIDGVTKAEYQENLEENLQNLIERMKRQAYKPQPLRRALCFFEYILKERRTKHPLHGLMDNYIIPGTVRLQKRTITIAWIMKMHSGSKIWKRQK